MLDMSYCDYCGRKAAYIMNMFGSHITFKCSACGGEFDAEIVDDLQPAEIYEICFRCGRPCDADGNCTNVDCIECDGFGLGTN